MLRYLYVFPSSLPSSVRDSNSLMILIVTTTNILANKFLSNARRLQLTNQYCSAYKFSGHAFFTSYPCFHIEKLFKISYVPADKSILILAKVA